MRFNPPPTWPPPPEGWRPPEGWTPGPEWPAVPDGWPLWVDDRSSNAPLHPGSGKGGHGVLITSLACAVVLLLAGIAGAAFYVVEQLRPHEYEVKFFASGKESYVEVRYGFESVADAGDYRALKTRDWDVGSGGHWGFDELELFSGQPRTAVINLVVDQSRSSESGTISCAISVDGEVMARSEEFSVRDHPVLQCAVEVG